MLRALTPDYLFDKFDDITPEFLLERGCRFLFSDVDNTLAPYETAEPDERIRRWLDSLRDAGIEVVFVSNNDSGRLELFNRSLGFRYYANCKKPSRKRMRKALEEMGALPENTAMLGDQIFTDVWVAKRLSLSFAMLVPPIRDKRTPLFRFKRALEKPVLWHYHRMQRKTQTKTEIKK